jgi:hypothetical protein
MGRGLKRTSGLLRQAASNAYISRSPDACLEKIKFFDISGSTSIHRLFSNSTKIGFFGKLNFHVNTSAPHLLPVVILNNQCDRILEQRLEQQRTHVICCIGFEEYLRGGIKAK